MPARRPRGLPGGMVNGASKAVAEEGRARASRRLASSRRGLPATLDALCAHGLRCIIIGLSRRSQTRLPHLPPPRLAHLHPTCFLYLPKQSASGQALQSCQATWTRRGSHQRGSFSTQV